MPWNNRLPWQFFLRRRFGISLARRRTVSPPFASRQIVVPNFLGWFTFVEEQQICFHTCAGRVEDSTGQTDNAVQVAFVQHLAFRLHDRRFVCAEQDTFVQHHAATAGRRGSLCRWCGRQLNGVFAHVWPAFALNRLTNCSCALVSENSSRRPRRVEGILSTYFAAR